VINSSEDRYEGRLTLGGEEKPAEVRNIINEQPYPFKYMENKILLDISMPAKGVCVFRID
jgi:hypothetical protein